MILEVIITKYKRNGNLVKDYIVLDFETTGLNSYNDEIIGKKAIKYKGFIKIGRFKQIIKPESLVDSYILELTGVTQAKIDKILKIENVIDDYLNFIEGFPLKAHNSSFDMRVLMF